jgi:hypothetical protein
MGARVPPPSGCEGGSWVSVSLTSSAPDAPFTHKSPPVTGGGGTLALNQLAPIEMPLATEFTLSPTTATTTSSTGSNNKGYDLTTNKPA